MMKVCKFLSAVLLPILACLLPQASHAKNAPFKVQYYPGVAFTVTFYVAQAEGMFQKHGLDIETVGMTSGPAALAAMSGGSVDAGMVNPDLLIASRKRGLNLEAFCAASGSYFELVGAKSFIPKPYPEVMRQIAGKRVGVNALGASGQFFMEAMLQGAGLDKDAVTFVPVSSVAGIEAMQNNRIDLFMSFEPVTTILTQKTGGKVLWSVATSKGPSSLTDLRVGLIWVAKSNLLDKDPGKYKAFISALKEAKAFIDDPANADKVAEDVVKLAGVNTSGMVGGDATLHKVVKNKLMHINSVTRFGAKDAARWLEYMKQYQGDMVPGLDKPDEAKKFIDQLLWAGGCK